MKKNYFKSYYAITEQNELPHRSEMRQLRVPFLFLFRLKIWKKMLTEHKVYSTITQCDIVR